MLCCCGRSEPYPSAENYQLVQNPIAPTADRDCNVNGKEKISNSSVPCYMYVSVIH